MNEIPTYISGYREEDKGNVLVRKVYNEELGQEQVNQVCLKDKYDANNKRKTDIIQSFIITAARYDFSIYEKRILFRIIECFQYLLENKKLDKSFSVKENLYGDITITLPLSSLLMKGKGDTNYVQIKKAFDSLLNKKISFENNKVWTKFTLIVKPEIIKYKRIVTFRLHQEVYEALLDFSKGYRKYELETARCFNSVYSMRFYELISGQNNSLTYTIDGLKVLFNIENKYKLVKDFIFNVIEPAKKELDLKSPFSFTYQLKYEKERVNLKGGRKKIIGIIFIPIYNANNRDKVLAYRDKCRNIELLDILFKEEKDAFLSFGFNENELKTKYYALFQDINKARKQGIVIFTSTIIEYAQKARNPKIYLIKALRKEIKKWKETLLKKQSSNILISEKNDIVNYKKEKIRVYSFLKNHLDLSVEELNVGIDYVLEQNGTVYLNELLRKYNNDDKKIKIHIKNGIAKQLLYRTVDKKQIGKFMAVRKLGMGIKSKKVIVPNYISKNENNSKHKMITTNSKLENDFLTTLQSKQSKSVFIQKKLKKDWKSIIYKQMNFGQKLLYKFILINNKWLKNYAKKKNIYINQDENCL